MFVDQTFEQRRFKHVSRPMAPHAGSSCTKLSKLLLAYARGICSQSGSLLLHCTTSLGHSISPLRSDTHHCPSSLVCLYPPFACPNLNVLQAGAHGFQFFTCALCGHPKPFTEFPPHQLTQLGQPVCSICLQATAPQLGAAPAMVHPPMAGEGIVRCVACCQLKPTSAFGVNQLRRRAGIERCAACVQADKGSVVRCTACHRERPFTDFSKKQLACKPGAERCRECIEASTTG